MHQISRQISYGEAAASISALPDITRGQSRLSTQRQQQTATTSHFAEGQMEEKSIPEVEPNDPLAGFPDGGLRAWLVVVGAFWTVFCGFGLTAGSGAFQTIYSTSILPTYSQSTISWITSTQAFVTFGLACFTGSLFDRYGHRPLIAIGTFCLTLGFCMLSLCTKYYQILVVHITLIAWGCNLLFICPMGVLGQWFLLRRGIAYGIMSTGSSLGAVVWPLLLADLPPRIGFAWTCRVMALISLFCGILSFFLLKTRLPSRPSGSFFYLDAFKNLQYICVVINYWTFSFGFFAFLTFIGTYGTLSGFGDFAPYLLIIQNACSAVGRIASGAAADRTGVYNVVTISSLIMCVMFWVWIACTTKTACIILVVIQGAAGGAFVSLQAPMATQTATDMRYGGTMVGQALFVQSFSQLICGPIFGAVLGTGTREQQLARFPRAIALGASMIMIATAAVVVARWKAVGWKILVKT